jgi:hypothetical protein
MKKSWAVALSFALAIFLNSSSAQGASTKNLKDLYFSITYPSQIKLPKGKCGTLKVKYSIGLKMKQKDTWIVFVILAKDSDMASMEMLSRGSGSTLNSPDKGTINLKYCKEDWLDESGDAYLGVSPGTYTIGFAYEGVGFENEKESTIKIVK